MDKRTAQNDVVQTDLLSAREREVAELVVHGKSNRAIAEALFLSERTVESHVSSIFAKLNVHSRVELAAAVLRGAVTTGGDTARHQISSNNLPIQPTSFLGREHDVAEVKSLIGRHNLVTVFGAGGVGKTRLALTLGADLLDRYEDGVWFADLAPVTDPELVSSVVAKVLGVSQQEGHRVDESITQWLKRKQLLLILDNCEHVLEAAASIADAIMRSCMKVRMIATSRQALNIGGEVVYRLPSLAMPDKAAGLRTPEALRYAAIALFVDRAKAADNRFALTDETVPAVAEICRHLDGIPLAIELAAARVTSLSVPSIAQRLNDRFKILTGGGRTAAPRQRTLSALIDWSYGLLNPKEQVLFRRLGIFAGGLSLDAATSVCAGDGLHENEVADLLWSLTDKSLVIADTGGVQEHYRLLESTRAYALEKLEAPSERERLARRHAEYFRDQAQAADERWGTGSTGAWLADVEMELDNYRATLEWALTDGHDAVLGGIVAGVLERLWHNGGLTAEGRYWIGRAQACLDESAHPQVAARLWGALALLLTGGKRMYDCGQRALTLYQSVGDNRGEAWALLYIGGGLTRMGRFEDAGEAFDRALSMLRACGDQRGVAVGLSGQALNERCRGDIVASRELYAQALNAFKALGNETAMGALLGDLAELEFADAHVEEARRLVDEAIDVRMRGKNATYLANGYYNKAAYCIAMGDEDAGQEAAREGLQWARQAQFALGIATALQHFALLGALRRHARDAARLIGYVNVQFKELGYERESTEQWSLEKLMTALREQLTTPEIEALAVEGVAWSEDQAVEESLKI